MKMNTRGLIPNPLADIRLILIIVVLLVVVIAIAIGGLTISFTALFSIIGLAVLLIFLGIIMVAAGALTKAKALVPIGIVVLIAGIAIALVDVVLRWLA